MTSCRSFRSSV